MMSALICLCHFFFWLCILPWSLHNIFFLVYLGYAVINQSDFVVQSDESTFMGQNENPNKQLKKPAVQLHPFFSTGIIATVNLHTLLLALVTLDPFKEPRDKFHDFLKQILASQLLSWKSDFANVILYSLQYVQVQTDVTEKNNLKK